MASGRRSPSLAVSGGVERAFGINRAWEGFCTLCICGPCGLSPVVALRLISFISFTSGLLSLTMGIWLTTLVLLNGSLALKNQIYFEKLQISESGTHDYFINESSFVFTPIDNLNFYLLSISTIAILGGIGRTIASLCLYIYYFRKKVLSGLVSWAWVILSMLSVVSLGIVTVDTFYTLSHNDLAPPHIRDFYFKNDTYGFYTFCHTYKWFILIDFIITSYFQWVVRWFHRSFPIGNEDHPDMDNHS